MSSAPQPDEDEIDLGQVLMALWSGKVPILIVTFLAISAGAFNIANTRPTFQSDALLQLEENTGALALPRSLTDMVGEDPRSVTEIEILSSRSVLGRAVADQNLDWRIQPKLVPLIGTMLSRYRIPLIDPLVPTQFARPGDNIALHHLVVPPSWLNDEIELVVLSDQRFELTLPDERKVEGTVGNVMTLGEEGFSIEIERLDAKEGRSFTISQLDETQAIKALKSRLDVSERGRASGILEVRLRGADKNANVRALNAIISAYLLQNVNRSAAQAQSSITFLKEQLPQAELNLREAEDALNVFRREKISVNLEMETQAILEQLAKLEGELSGLDRREDELRQRYNPAHPVYKALLDDRGRILARQAELQEQVGNLPEVQREMLALSRGVELTQQIYTELLTRAQEVEVLRASTIGNVRIIDEAASAALPIAPRKSVILALSMALGILAGIALVLIRNWSRRGVKDASELEKLGLPVYAAINYSKDADTHQGRHGTLPILAVDKPSDITIEALRSLRTSLHFAMLDARSKALCLTSSHPGAGKSFLALNLAVVAAQAGQRVCLIDADLRRGQLRRHFDLARNHPGLAEVLAGGLPVEQAMMRGAVENLSFLPTGRYPPNPSELLMRAELSNLVEWCGENFDLTIFDTPPALAVTDPVIVSRNTGATIFVARHGATHIGEVEATIKTFSAAGLRMAGSVLNAYAPERGAGGYGYGYGYGYRYDYKRREEEVLPK